MPILEVEIVTGPGEELPADLAARLADGAAGVFASGPQQTWVRLRALPGRQYAENGGAGAAAPVFVSVLRARLPAPPALAAEALALAEVVALACGRPADQVHISYEPPGAGRIAFGGRLSEG